MPVQLAAITADDLPAVGRFLHHHLNRRVPAESWVRALQVPWKVAAPNHGFLLRDRDAVVGAYLAFYSERVINGRPERFCNLGAWCVLPDYRFHAARLLRALLAQPDFHFTDLSPSGNVPAINTRLGFRFLDTATVLLPNLPWPSLPRPGRSRASSHPSVLAEVLTGPEWEIYQDHREAAAARHVLLRRGDRSCYVVFRRDRRKRLPLFGSILYASDPALLSELARPLTRHLLLRHGMLATLAHRRLLPHRPWWSVRLRADRPKMFRSSRLAPEQIDYLYSELACVAW